MTLLGAAQPLARHLLAATLSVVVPVTPTIPAYATTAPVVATVLADETPRTLELSGAPAAPSAEHRQETRAGLRVYEVKAPQGGHHDTLWNAAKQHLRDPRRYVEIIELNLGRTMTDGQIFTANHRLIQPGWRLLMPADATGLPLATSNDRHGRTTPPSDTSPDSGLETTVEEGDSLWTLGEAALRKALARQPSDAETAPYVEQVIAANRDRLTDPSNPGLVYAGQRVALPPVPVVHQPGASQPAERPALPERPSATPTPSPTSPVAPTPTIAPASPSPTDEPDHLVPPGPRPETLPDGSRIAVSVLVALAAASTLVRLRRRRRHRPGPPGPVQFHSAPSGSPLRTAISTAAARDSGIDEIERVSTWLTAGAENPTPGLVPVGHNDTVVVPVDLVGEGPVALAMPDAAAISRAIIVSFLATAGPRDGHAIVPATLYDELLAGAQPFRGLTRADNLEDALTTLDNELLGRARLLDAADITNVTDYRERNPDGSMPAILLVVPAEGDHGERIAAIASAGRRLGIGVLYLGAASAAQLALGVDANGQLESHPVDERLTGTRPYTLTQEAAADALALLADAGREAQDSPADAAPAEEDFAAPVTAVEDAGSDANAGASPRFAVRVLGTYAFSFDGEPIPLRASRELFAYLVTHPDGATMEEIVDAIAPEAPAKKISTIFWNQFGPIRRRARDLMGQPDFELIARDGDVFRVDRRYVTADLWAFQRALAQVRAAEDVVAKRTALHEAMSHYGGELLRGLPYEWAEETRERVRHSVVDLLVSLADLAEADEDTETARLALEHAMEIAPLVEDVYRRLMRLHIDAGEHSAARQVFRRLSTELATIDAEPDETTSTLAQIAARGAAHLSPRAQAG